MAERLTIDIPDPRGGWLPPWPNVPVGRGRAAVLLCCLEDPYADRSDHARVEVLRQALPDGHAAWLALAAGVRVQGQAALRILAAP